MASSREPDIDSSINVARYIKLDFVGFFFDWSRIIRIAIRAFDAKSSL
jgi:hypothetical protein